MAEILLVIDPSTLNVIKYVVIALVLTPVFEILADSLVSAKSTYDVLRGDTVDFSHSELGIFSLHGTYWGRGRNRFILVALGFAVIATELLFEFSFSSTTVDLDKVQQVWKQPSHAKRYIPALGRDRILYREPTEFLSAVALHCIRGPLTMLRFKSNHTDGNERYEGGLEFRLNGSYTIRKPYRARSDNEVLCSANKKTANASFLVPRVVRTRTASQVEGVSLEIPTSGYEHIKSIVKDNRPPVINLFLYTDTEVGEVRTGGSGTCVGFFWCLVRDRDGSFVLVFLSSDSIVVVMKASGSALSGLTESGRQIRLISAIIYENLFTGLNANDLSPSLRVADKNDMETLARWMIVAANEEGVGGLKSTTVNRTVVGGSRQMATATELLPVSISGLVVIGGLLVASCFLLRVMIARMGNKQLPFRVRFWRQWRLGTSKQYMRARVLDDLHHIGLCESATLQDIGLRLGSHDGFDETIRLIPRNVNEDSVGIDSRPETRADE